MKKLITVIGSSNVDLFMTMDHLPSVGETVTDAEFFQVYGGKGANQAVGAARAGGQVAFVSCVGNDAYTPRMLENFKADGMDIRFVFREEDVPSGHALIMVGKAGMNYLSVAPGANYALTPDKIEKARPVIEPAAMIVMQYELPRDTTSYVLDMARELGIPVMWNFAPAREYIQSDLGKPDILVTNEVETEYLTGTRVRDEDDARHAAGMLLARGVGTVVVTLGERGALAFRKGEVFRAAAHRVEAVDTTSAGDVFCGSLAVALVEGKQMEEAMQFANAAAALCVTRAGAQPSAPTRTEIEAFLRERSG